MSQTPPEESGAGAPSRDRQDLIAQPLPAVADVSQVAAYLGERESESAMAPRSSRSRDQHTGDEPGSGTGLAPSSAASLGVAGGRQPTVSQTRRVSRRASTNPYASESRGAGRREDHEADSGLPVAGPSRPATEAARTNPSNTLPSNLSLSIPDGEGAIGGSVPLERQRSSASTGNSA